MNLHYAALAAFVATGAFATWSDVRVRRLPNWLCLLVFILGAAFAVLTGGLSLLGSGLLHALAALLVGMLLFAGGIIGGGDGKYYTAVALWFPLRLALSLLLYVSLSGLLLIIIWFAARRLMGVRIAKANVSDADRFPYGVPIAVGAALLLASFPG